MIRARRVHGRWQAQLGEGRPWMPVPAARSGADAIAQAEARGARMHWPFGWHWSQRAVDQVRATGASYTWVNTDTLGDPAFAGDVQSLIESDLSIILQLNLNSEGRLRNTAGAWERDVANVLAWVRHHGLLSRILALQVDDEWWSNFYTSAGRWPAMWWPSVHGAPLGPDGSYRYLFPHAAPLVDARLADLRRIWGADLPAAGIGMAETGGVIPPTEGGLDWWGCNFYLGRQGWYLASPAAVHRKYAEALRHTSLRIMPVLGILGETVRGVVQPPPSLAEMRAAYLPVLEAHADRIWAVGLFCLHHPSAYAAADHGHGGRGLLELPGAYREGVQWLTSTYGRLDPIAT